MGLDEKAGPPTERSKTESSVPPPRGPRLWVILAVIAFGAVMLVAGILWGSARRAQQKETTTTGEAAEGAAKRYYTCGMHPWVVLPNPGDCPICHMKLVPIDPAKFTGQVAINPVITQNIGVRVAPVISGPATFVIRTVGTVDYDETRVTDITTKVSGWIEKLHVNYEGERVKKGQPLFDLYSPDLYGTQEEYLLAFKNKDVKVGGLEGNDLYEAARKKLSYYDVSDAQIAELEKTGVPSKAMTISSPFDGLVVMKNAFAGMQVQAGMQVYRLADLSRVWIMVTLYEHQLPYLRPEQEATVSLPYIPGQTWKGKVAYIYPYLNTELRQVKARLEFDNPEMNLMPGMYANVELHSTFAEHVTLAPREAVVDTGLRQMAFVSLGEGRFEPRQVQVGGEAQGGQVVILDGLKPGEMVVVSGEFLLDSEARTREALAKIIGGSLAATQTTPGAPAGAGVLTSLPEAVGKALCDLLDGYLAVGAKLSNDSVEGFAASGQKMVDAVKALLKTQVPDYPNFWPSHVEVTDIAGKAAEIAADTDIAKAREDFCVLSVAVSKLLHATGIPPSYAKPIEELHCPMFHEGQGGTIWLQAAGAVRNPFFGSAMIGCFDRRATLPVTGAAAHAPPPPSPPPAPPQSPSSMPPMPGM